MMSSTQKTPKAPSRKILGEKGVAKELIGDFIPEGSRGMLFLERYFNKGNSIWRLTNFI